MAKDEKLIEAFENFDKAEEDSKGVWAAPVSETEDTFEQDLKDTAKVVMGAIKKTANSAYELEARDLSQLSKAICDLQNAFFGKQDSGNTFIQANQLAMFKDMLK